MANNTREIKRRINSVSSTSQITKALQMVSASKMNKAQEHAKGIETYAQGLYDIVGLMGNIDDYESIYTKKIDETKNIVLLIIGPDRGFVGSLVSAQTILINDFVDNYRLKHSGVSIKSITKHRVAKRISDVLNFDNLYHFEEYQDNPTPSDLSSLNTVLLDGFKKGKFDEIYVSYNHFVNTIIQKPIIKKLLPIEFEKAEESKNVTTDMTFEPTKSEVLDTLLPEYFQTQVLDAIVESIASEHSARMVAMQNATDNANELRNELELSFNRSRQAKVTSEILDIVGGSRIINQN